MVDLTRTDVYSTDNVPDEDVEVAMKVLRTLRGVATNMGNGRVAVAASEAYRALYQIAKECNKHEEEQKSAASQTESEWPGPDPDLQAG